MNDLEPKNPLASAKVVGENIDVLAYCRQDARRGDNDYVMSRGELMEFNRCPHRWRAGYKESGTTQTDWGTLIDCLLLSPDKFDVCFAVAPATYKNDKGEAKPWNRNAKVVQEWEAQHSSKSVLKSAEFTEAQSAVNVLLYDQEIKELLEKSRKQVMVVAEYNDVETSLVIPLKGLIDFVPNLDSAFPKSLGDLKTCESAAPYAWAKSVYQYGYYVQAALYLDAYTLATGEERLDFLHLLQESYAPYEVGKRILTVEFIELGRQTYIAALKRYARCLQNEDWPGYDAEQRESYHGWTFTNPEPWMIAKF